MEYIIYLLMLMVFGIVMGFTYTEGLWSNLLRLCNIVTSGLLAIGLSGWIFGMIREQWSGFKFIGLFLSIWLIFDLSYLILHALCKAISHVKVRFIGVVDHWGGIVVATFNGFIFLGFALFTMHVAPLAPSFLWGGFHSDGQILDTTWGKLAEHVSNSVYPGEEQFTWSEWTQGGNLLRTETAKSVEAEKGLFGE